MESGMLNADRIQDIKLRLKRRALPLAFLVGFLASVIAVDPFSGRGDSGSGSEPVDSMAHDPFANPEGSYEDEFTASSETNLFASDGLSSDGVSGDRIGSESSEWAGKDTPEGMTTERVGGGGAGEASASVSAIGGLEGVSEIGSAHPFDRAFPRSEGVAGSAPEIKSELKSEIKSARQAALASRKPANAQAWEGEDSLQNLQFDDGEPLWSGKAQLLPSPMFVEQLTSKRMKAIRGSGWMAIDLARGEVWPVELFKSTSANFTSRAIIEAKVVRVSQDGHGRVLNTVNTGIPIVRGIAGVVPGAYEVPETPACLARYSIVTKEEVCSAPRPRSAGGAQIRFRFEPPVASAAIPEGGNADPLSEDGDFQFTTVYVETQPGKWSEIGTFNESFTPIGDANRDGYPDFYLESLSDSSSGGRHDLLISSPQGDGVIYTTYSARFIGR